MIGEKWLSDVIFTTVKSKADISRVKDAPGGDFQVKALSSAVNTSETNEITFRAWQSRASKRESTLVFCVDLQHVADLTETFRSHGFDAQYITGDTKKQIRSERLEGFKNRQFPVLLNCGIFTEGTDIPNIDCVLLARPTKSRNLLVQMIGRGMRLYPGKRNCHVIDMVASLEVGIVTVPTLFGLDPEAMVEEAKVETMKSLKERQELEKTREERAVTGISAPGGSLGHSRSRSLAFTDYESVHDLLDDTTGEQHIRKSSSLAWVLVGEGRYVLSTQSGSYLTIERLSHESNGSFQVIFTQATTPLLGLIGKIKSPYMKPRQIALSNTLEDAIHAADTFATEKFNLSTIRHRQSWRKQPATEGQLKMLNKTRAQDDQLTPEMITKGKAGDMITKMKHGAKGRFDKINADKRRDLRAQGKINRTQEMKNRERVQVGPLS